MRTRVILNLGGASIRYDVLDGEECIVAPVAAMAEGIWEGSEGAFFYPKEEHIKAVPAWNHRPLVIYHPEDTANKASVLNNRGVGITLGAGYDDKLRMEAWAKTRRLREVDARVLNALKEGKVLEVSTGLLFDVEEKEIEWNGKKCNRIARNHVPDHLAILPDKVGAYSIAAGGGVLVHNAAHEPERNIEIFRRSILNAVRPLGLTWANNELSFSSITRQLAELLAAAHGQPGKYWDGSVIEVYPDYVIFCMEDYKDTYRQDYNVRNDEVSLSGSAQKVKREVLYTPVKNESPHQEQESEMATTFDRKAKIDKLIQNGLYTEALRSELEKIPDTVLILMPDEKAGNPVQQNNQQPTVNPPAPPAIDVKALAAEVIKAMPGLSPTQQVVLNDMERTYQQVRQDRINFIKNSGCNPYGDEYLNGLDNEALLGLVHIVQTAKQQTAAAAASGGGQTQQGAQNQGGGSTLLPGIYQGMIGGPQPVLSLNAAPPDLNDKDDPPLRDPRQNYKKQPAAS